MQAVLIIFCVLVLFPNFFNGYVVEFSKSNNRLIQTILSSLAEQRERDLCRTRVGEDAVLRPCLCVASAGTRMVRAPFRVARKGIRKEEVAKLRVGQLVSPWVE